jgi:hypothetical protein
MIRRRVFTTIFLLYTVSVLLLTLIGLGVCQLVKIFINNWYIGAIILIIPAVFGLLTAVIAVIRTKILNGKYHEDVAIRIDPI